MAVQTPASVTKLDDNQLDFGSATSEATFKALGQNVNQLIDSTPIGTIQAFAINLPGVPTPNSAIWQLCDGAEITHPESPLRTIGASTRFTPNLVGRFLKGSDNPGQNVFDGSNVSSRLAGEAAFIDVQDFYAYETTVFPQLFQYFGLVGKATVNDVDFSVDINPEHYTVAYYLKIN